MSKEALKKWFTDQNMELSDDNFIYSDKKIIAKNVNLVNSEDDYIAFEFDLIIPPKFPILVKDNLDETTTKNQDFRH